MKRNHWALLALACLISATSAQAARRALVIAYNGSEEERDRIPLRYADDDGLFWVETFERLGIETTLLTTADPETARLDRAALEKAEPPTLQHLRAAVEALRLANAKDLASGKRAEVFVVYVGHGDVDLEGTAFFTLLGSTLKQGAFYAEVVDRLGADVVHVLVDACHAAGVVGSRGGDQTALVRRLEGMLKREQLSSRPHVGVVFAESNTGQTHEWSKLQSGVFSHILRSGLLGAADVNADGAIEYSELAAFASAALAGLEGLSARMAVRTYAPLQSPRAPLVKGRPEGPELFLPPNAPLKRFWVEDGAGFRLATIHRAKDEPLLLALPSRAQYVLKTERGEARLSPEELEDDLPAPRLAELASRGALASDFERGLFQRSYGRNFYEGFTASNSFVPVPLDGPVRLPSRRSRMPRFLRGLEVGASVGWLELGTVSRAYGGHLAWRSSAVPVRLGVRLAYDVGPKALGQRYTMHHGTLLGIGSYEPRGLIAPTLELGLGGGTRLSPVSGGTQATLFIPTGRLALGARWTLSRMTFRGALNGTVERMETRVSESKFHFTPGLELGLELGERNAWTDGI